MHLMRGMHNLVRRAERGKIGPMAATIGNFDGLHLGHRKMLDRVRQIAAGTSTQSGAFFFDPHPREFLRPAEAPARLMLCRDKIEGLKMLGMNRVVMLKFDDRMRQMEPETFVRDILLRAGVKHLLVGDDFRFGAGRAGDYSTLQELGGRLGMTVEDMPTVQLAGERISSTRVRQALYDGDLELATELLGNPWSYSGRVVEGRKMGRQLGFPTANLPLPPQRLAVAGVYAVRVKLRGDALEWPAVANVGVRPTFGGERKVLEAHLLDFSGDLYRQRIRVSFVVRLREEKKFSGPEALKEQIALDCQRARECLA